MARTLWCLTAAACLFLVVPVASAESPAAGYHVIKKYPVTGEGGWDYLTVDGAARRLYISRATRVQVLDLDTGTLVGEIANTPGVHGIALAPDHGKGFTSNGRENTVTIFDLKTLKELDRVKVGTNPDGILYDPASDRVFTFNGRSHDATAIDAATGKVAGTVKLGGKPESAACDGKGRVYVNAEDKSEVVVLDSKELKALDHWSVKPGEAAVGLAMDREHGRLFCTCGNQKMVVLDADKGQVVKDLPIGKGTDFCVFDPDTGLAFSSNGDGTLTIVERDGDSYRVAANVPTQKGARTMALDPKTHNIVLVTAGFKPQAPAASGSPRRRPEMEPGSFVVLIVGK
jgi:YVTN family beta-propeller protein